jgi:GNAT superfamily N-acetyltransferase
VVDGALRIDEEPPATPDARYCLSRYFEEPQQRFDAGFDAAEAAQSLDEFLPPLGAFLVARHNGKPVACGGIKPFNGAAYIKRMWVSPDARGLGLGKRLLAALEEKAGALGYCRICLETNRALTEAQRLYRSSGYREVPPFNDEPYAHHWFEKLLP